MSYIVEYTTLSGKRIPILHKIFESAADAESHGRKGVAEGNYRAYAVVEADEKKYRVTAKSLDDNSTFKGGLKSKEAADKEAEKLRNAKSKRGGKSFDNVKVVTENFNEAAPKLKGDSIKIQREKDREHADVMGRHVKSGRKKSYTSTQRSLAKMRGEELPEANLNEAYIKTTKDAIDTLGALRKIGKSIETGQGSYDGNLANMYANDVYDVISWVENNLDTNEPNYQKVLGPVIELRKKAKSMEREPGSGKDARFGNEIVNTLYPLMQWIEMNAANKTNEGYKELPKMDTERYGERAGLEGPFQTMAGKVVYYDPKEGAYYDPDTDMYMTYDEFKALDNDRTGMKEERDIPVKEAVTLDYSRYIRSHGKKPRDTGGATWMFTTAEYGSPEEDDIFQFQGNFADAKRAAAGWARSRGADRVYAMESDVNEADDDRNELTKKLFPKKSREEMEKADRERNRAYNQKRFMKPGKPSRSREWGAYESVSKAEAGTYMKQWYDYSEDFAMLELYVDGKLVDKWSDYFGANETGNPLQAKFIEIAKANGVDPIGLKVVDGEDGDEGVFTSSGLKWNTNEAVAKIACTKCDEVSTAKAWQKNNGFCPKCKTSSQGVAESINEGISDDAHHMERDHEVQMARSDLYKTANYAIKLHAILKGISEEQGLEGWMQAKITKAADYLSSVFHALEYDELERSQSEPMMPMESADKEKIQKQIDQTEKHMKSFSGNTSSVKMKKVALQKKIAGLKAKLEEAKKYTPPTQAEISADKKKDEKGKARPSMTAKSINKKTYNETTTAGGIATAPMPMGKMIKRGKK